MSKMFNYEADQIHDMVHPDLLTDTSHYVAECKEIILNEVTPNYPKLTEYEKEWLYFSEHVYQDGHPVNLEYQTVNIDGYASVENAIPFYYKEASLKGNTLVNKASIVERVIANDGWNHLTIRLNYPLSINSKYLINIFNLPNDMNYVLSDSTNINLIMPFYANKKTIFIPQYNSEDMIILHVNNSSTYRPLTQEEINKIQVIIIEYQEGMENWDIPYFEGMQSVQMPVLKTTGKNIFSPTKMNINDGSLYGYYKVKDDESVKYTLSVTDKDTSLNIGEVYFGVSKVGKNADMGINWLVTNGEVAFPTTSSITTHLNYISIYPNNIETLNNITKRFNIQIEFGEEKTTYEPYQSNILTVNEPVELRGIGNVKDELNLLTGEVTQRIGEVILNGETTEDGYTSVDDYIGQYTRHISELVDGKNEKLYLQGFFGNIGNSNDYILTNGFLQYKGFKVTDSELEEGLYRYAGSDHAYICVSASRFTEHTFEGIKKFLSENPQSYLVTNKESVVKTVDLCTNIRPYEGTNHYTLSSETIPPQLHLSVPVESTGAQTLNEINQEE